MTLIQELIKHFVLGIVSLIICSISMAEINKTKDFIKIINKVKKEFPEGSLERKIPTGFIATTSATETGNFNFKGAPTAMKANNYFGMHATGDQEFLQTTGGAKLRNFPDDKSLDTTHNPSLDNLKHWQINDKSNEDQLRAIKGICFIFAALALMGLYSNLL